MDSILTSVKLMLGITEECEDFDIQLIMHINSVLSGLTQMGIGPPEGFMIEDDSAEWGEFVSDHIAFVSVKSYVYLKTRLLFDPPSGAAMDAANRLITELEWRLYTLADNKRIDGEGENQNGE